MSKRIDHIKKHFDSESNIFDDRVVKIIPYYREMLKALVANIPFKRSEKIKVIDLGCGTGTVSRLIKEYFPNAQIKCVDLAPSMLELAKEKLKTFKVITCEIADFVEFDPKERFDVVATSLALHHIEPDKRKFSFYKKLFKWLKKDGVLINADVILATNKKTQQIYLNKWEEYILRSFNQKQVQQNYERYLREDRPAILMTEIEWLKEVGFKNVDIYWKYFNFAVYGGTK